MDIFEYFVVAVIILFVFGVQFMFIRMGMYNLFIELFRKWLEPKAPKELDENAVTYLRATRPYRFAYGLLLSMASCAPTFLCLMWLGKGKQGIFWGGVFSIPCFFAVVTVVYKHLRLKYIELATSFSTNHRLFVWTFFLLPICNGLIVLFYLKIGFGSASLGN